jgi:hypothetical protein
MRFARILGVAAIVSAIALTPAQSASADPFGGEPGGYPWRADSRDHWYCFHPSIPGGSQWVFHDAMANLDAQTVMWDRFASSCGSSTDIIYMDNPDLGYGIAGAALCWTLAPGSSSVCDQFWVALDPWEIANFWQPTYAPLDTHIQQNIRHETGHTTGLTHNGTPTSAMRSGLLPDLGFYNFVWMLYESPHHVDHINGAY